jgi:hypothetical protein
MHVESATMVWQISQYFNMKVSGHILVNARKASYNQSNYLCEIKYGELEACSGERGTRGLRSAKASTKVALPGPMAAGILHDVPERTLHQVLASRL